MLFGLAWIEFFSFLIVGKLGFWGSERLKSHIWNARVFLGISVIPSMRIRKDEIEALSLENRIAAGHSFASANVFGSEILLGPTEQADPVSAPFPLASVHVSPFPFWGRNCTANILLSYVPNWWVSKGLFDLFGFFSLGTRGAKGCAVACACAVESRWKRSLKSEGKINVGAYIYFEKRFRLLRSFLCLGCCFAQSCWKPAAFCSAPSINHNGPGVAACPMLCFQAQTVSTSGIVSLPFL